MKSGIRSILSILSGKGKIVSKKNASVFSFFLVLSVIFWFINALSKDYVSTINYPVRYSDIPTGKTLIGDSPDYLSLRISSHGYTILRYKLSSKYIPISFSVSSFSLNRVNATDSAFYIQTRYAREHLGAQLSPDIQILEIKPDTLYFRFASIVNKKLPVVANIIVEPDRQMIIKGSPMTDPDSVLVSGPDFILDTLNAIYTRFRNLGIISQTTERQIDLEKPQQLTLNQNRVKLIISIERFTEKTVAVPIEVINLPDSVKLITFPSVVEINCQVGLSNFPKVQPAMFRASVDFNETLAGTGNLTVSLTKQPDFVRSVRFSPKTLEFLITK